MRFSDAFLMEIKFRNDIEEIVSRYVPLKAAGSNMVACCPFHSEKTPSFTVSSGKQFFYCFGCGTGGDVITFVMLIENIDYVTAITKLAEAAKIPVPEDDGEYKERAVKQKRITELNRDAARYFHSNLIDPNNPESRNALEYISGRGIKSPAIKHFGLGYASNSWSSLTKYLDGKGYTKEEQKTAFLAGITKKGDYFDLFQGRLMFPIIDAGGSVIAFGGRLIVENGDKRKYLNSSDTPAFKKSRNLYALNFAKNAIGSGPGKKFDYFIMCEGYMDVIAMHQAGFTNAVASLGTAVTGDQARLMAKYAKKTVLAYDTDEAGKRAMQKAAELLNEVGIEVKVLNMGDAKDPDEYIKKHGRERLANQLVKPKGYTDSKLDAIYEKYDLENAEEKIKAINESCKELAGINSDVEREVYGGKLAERYKITYDSVAKEIKRLAAAREKKERSDMVSGELRKIEGLGDRVNPDRAKYPAEVKIEETILGIILNYPELYRETKYLFEDLFVSEFSKKIYALFKNAVESNVNFDTVMITRDLPPEETGRIMKMTASIDGRAIQKDSLEKAAGALREKKKNIDKENIAAKDLTIEEMAKRMREKGDLQKSKEKLKKGDN